MSTIFARKYSHSLQFTTLLARTFALRKKNIFLYFRRIKNNMSNLKQTIIFTSGKYNKDASQI